ncbi:hypothetical protein HDU67_000369 [Dinochytrium kinnereticum]|nr:hypothetical protein HDU67_000369 [Dinochytrium kinnereticum]
MDSFKKDWGLIYLEDSFNHENLDIPSLEHLLSACSGETSQNRIRIILGWSHNWPVSGNRLPIHQLILSQVGDGAGDGSLMIQTLWELSTEFPGSFDAIIPSSLILRLQKEVSRDVAHCKYCRLKLPLTEFDGKTQSCPRAKIYYACGCGQFKLSLKKEGVGRAQGMAAAKSTEFSVIRGGGPNGNDEDAGRFRVLYEESNGQTAEPGSRNKDPGWCEKEEIGGSPEVGREEEESPQLKQTELGASGREGMVQEERQDTSLRSKCAAS